MMVDRPADTLTWGVVAGCWALNPATATNRVVMTTSRR
jgi:hypothetical protein